MSLTSPARALLASLALVLWPAHAQAPADLRIALVIGNSAYAMGPLANPANDARAMSEVLRSLGFTVTELRDAPRAEMMAAVQAVGQSLRGKHGVGMLYYAGHGLQVDWHNYMVPVDARLASAADVPRQTVELDSVIAAFKAADNRMNIVVLDACRDNPFAGTASGKGLAQLDAPPGTFLAFATAPGNVADDGDPDGGNGLYTSYLLQELKKPQARIEDVFKRVRLAVRMKSKGRQIPWESTSLEEDFYFQPAGQLESQDAAVAQAQVDREAALWERTKSANTAASYAAYLAAHPSGHFSELAQARMDRLDKPAVVPQYRADDKLANDTTTERFRLGDYYRYSVKARGVFADPNPKGFKEFRVTAIEDELVQVNDGKNTFDRLGNIQSRKEKHWRDAQFFPADYAVGKKWSLVASLETDMRNDVVNLQARVAERERITVPAGVFDVFRVEVGGKGQQGHRYTWTFWMNPKYGMPVKWVEARHNPKGRLGKEATHELIALEAQR